MREKCVLEKSLNFILFFFFQQRLRTLSFRVVPSTHYHCCYDGEPKQ